MSFVKVNFKESLHKIVWDILEVMNLINIAFSNIIPFFFIDPFDTDEASVSSSLDTLFKFQFVIAFGNVILVAMFFKKRSKKDVLLLDNEETQENQTLMNTLR